MIYPIVSLHQYSIGRGDWGGGNKFQVLFVVKKKIIFEVGFLTSFPRPFFFLPAIVQLYARNRLHEDTQKKREGKSTITKSGFQSGVRPRVLNRQDKSARVHLVQVFWWRESGFLISLLSVSTIKMSSVIHLTRGLSGRGVSSSRLALRLGSVRLLGAGAGNQLQNGAFAANYSTTPEYKPIRSVLVANRGRQRKHYFT